MLCLRSGGNATGYIEEINVNEIAIDALLDLVTLEMRAEDAGKNMARWTQEEDEFIRENYAQLSEEEMGEILGRSPTAVHLRRERELQLPGPMKDPAYYTTQKISEMLGCDSHGPVSWVDRGLLPGEYINFSNGRVVRRVAKTTFLKWLADPEHWIYFKFDKVVHPDIRRYLEARQREWGDEWWNNRQAADYHQAHPKDILRCIKLGRLPGAIQAIDPAGRNPNGRWNFWYVRRSEVERLVIPRNE